MILSRHYRIRADELNRMGFLTPETLIAYMQDAAAHHARDLGCGIDELGRQGRGWALSQLRLEVSQMPKWGEEVTVETWPSGIDRLFAFRDYRLIRNGTEFGRSESSWLIFDLNKRKPCRLPVEFRELAAQRCKKSRLKRLDLPDLRNLIRSTTVTVREDDTDFNGHVNHVRIVQWLLSHGQGEGKLRSLQVDFRAEAGEGDRVLAEWAQDTEGICCTLTRTHDRKLLALARTEFSSLP